MNVTGIKSVKKQKTKKLFTFRKQSIGLPQKNTIKKG